jgi:ubiquinone/menaquinone biosynthesis C-methylase UbiE
MSKQADECQYWSKAANSFDAATAYIVGTATQQEIRIWLANQFENTDVVLELGCGTGLYSETVAGSVKHLIATDLSWEMLEQAKDRLHGFNNVEVQKANCYHTSLPDNTFDAVFLGNLIHVVEDPVAALQESHRVLRSGGDIVMVDSTWYGMPLWSKLGMALRYFSKFGIPPRQNRNLRPAEVAEMVEKIGFSVEELRLVGSETKAICLRGQKTE